MSGEVTLREFIESRFESLEKLMQVEIARLDRDATRAASKAEAAAAIAGRTEDKLDGIERKLDEASGRSAGIGASGRFVAALVASAAGLIVITSIVANYLTGH